MPLSSLPYTRGNCHPRDCLAAAHPMCHQFLDPLDSFLLLFMGE